MKSLDDIIRETVKNPSMDDVDRRKRVREILKVISRRLIEKGIDF